MNSTLRNTMRVWARPVAVLGLVCVAFVIWPRSSVSSPLSADQHTRLDQALDRIGDFVNVASFWSLLGPAFIVLAGRLRAFRQSNTALVAVASFTGTLLIFWLFGSRDAWVAVLDGLIPVCPAVLAFQKLGQWRQRRLARERAVESVSNHRATLTLGGPSDSRQQKEQTLADGFDDGLDSIRYAFAPTVSDQHTLALLALTDRKSKGFRVVAVSGGTNSFDKEVRNTVLPFPDDEKLAEIYGRHFMTTRQKGNNVSLDERLRRFRADATPYTSAVGCVARVGEPMVIRHAHETCPWLREWILKKHDDASQKRFRVNDLILIPVNFDDGIIGAILVASLEHHHLRYHEHTGKIVAKFMGKLVAQAAAESALSDHPASIAYKERLPAVRAPHFKRLLEGMDPTFEMALDQKLVADVRKEHVELQRGWCMDDIETRHSASHAGSQ